MNVQQVYIIFSVIAEKIHIYIYIHFIDVICKTWQIEQNTMKGKKVKSHIDVT